MTRPTSFVLRLGALAVFTAAAALAQTGAIAGKVTGPDGQPLKDGLVKIVRTDIKGNYKVKSNKKGEYFHAGLPLGRYDVTLEVDGKDVDTVRGVRTTLGDPTPVNFDMAQRAQQQAALQKAAETGQLTEEQSRELSPEQKAALEKQLKERSEAMKKNKALNDAFNAGMTAMQAKQWDEAVTQFAKAGEMDPKQHVVWANLADSYLGQASTKPAAEQAPIVAQGLDAWAKAIELKPDDPAYHNNFALALVKANKIPEAEAELEKAAILDSANAGKYYYNLGAILTNMGQLEPAGAAFKKAIDTDPKHGGAQYQYGIYLMSKATTTAEGKVVPPEGTKEAFAKYLELEPTGAFADSAKGMLQMLDATVETSFENPDAKSKKKSTRKK